MSYTRTLTIFAWRFPVSGCRLFFLVQYTPPLCGVLSFEFIYNKYQILDQGRPRCLERRRGRLADVTEKLRVEGWV